MSFIVGWSCRNRHDVLINPFFFSQIHPSSGTDQEQQNIYANHKLYLCVLFYLLQYYIFIRFNPDTNRQRRGQKTEFGAKLAFLVAFMSTQITRIQNEENTKLFDIFKLFYCEKCSANGSNLCVCEET